MSEPPRGGLPPQPDSERSVIGQSASTQLQISAVQVIASSLAAVSAAVVCSFAGVTGTIVGTAVASACATTASALYAHSLRRTRERLRNVPLRHPGALPPLRHQTAGRPDPPPPSPDAGSISWRERLRALPWRRVALAAVGVFVVSAAAITVIELGAGGSLASMLRGGKSGGATFVPGSGSQPATTPRPGHQTTPSPSGTSPTAPATTTSPPPTSQSSPAPSGESSPPPSSPPGGVLSSLISPSGAGG